MMACLDTVTSEFSVALKNTGTGAIKIVRILTMKRRNFGKLDGHN